MGRLRLLFLAFALLVLAPGAVLVRYGWSWLEAERERLETGVRGELARELERLEAAETKRPYYHYQLYFASPETVAYQLALNRSPIGLAPPDPMVRAYFEVVSPDDPCRGPATGFIVREPEDVAALEQQARRLDRLRKLAGPVLEALLPKAREGKPSPAQPASAPSVAEEETTKFLVVCQQNALLAYQEIEEAQKGDPGSEKKLKDAWSQHQNVAKQQKEGRGKSPPPPETAIIRTYAFEYLPIGGNGERSLLAVRRVDVDGVPRLQGYELDLPYVRSKLLGQALERLDLAGEARLSARTPWKGAAKEATSQAGSAAETTGKQGSGSGAGADAPDARPRLYRTALDACTLSLAVEAKGFGTPLGWGRALVYGSAGLLFLIGTAGLGLLYSIVRGQFALARKQTDFVAAVSHELKAPLTAIRAFAEMLADGIVPTREKEREYFGQIRHEADRLSRLVANVLDFARLERRERRYELAAGDSGEVARAAVETFRPHLVAQGFEVSLEVDADLPPVRLDRDALLQVLVNLLDNAA